MAEPTILSPEVVQAYLSLPIVRATMDDDNDGAIDNAVLNQLTADSEAIFYASTRGSYETPFSPPIDPFAVAVCLDILHCRLVRRFPSLFTGGEKICEQAADLLKQIRSGDLQLAHPPKGSAVTDPNLVDAGPEVFSEPQRMPAGWDCGPIDTFYRNDD